MSPHRPILTAIALALALAASAPALRAQTSYPMLSRVEPTAVQRGTTVEVAIAGTGSFAGARQLLCERPGLEGEVLDGDVEKEKAAAKGMARAKAAVKARLTVAS